MTYIFGDLGRSWSIFRDLGSKGKILLGSQGNYFQGSGEINALFSGIKGAQTPPGGASMLQVKARFFLLVDLRDFFQIYGRGGGRKKMTGHFQSFFFFFFF